MGELPVAASLKVESGLGFEGEAGEGRAIARLERMVPVCLTRRRSASSLSFSLIFSQKDVSEPTAEGRFETESLPKVVFEVVEGSMRVWEREAGRKGMRTPVFTCTAFGDSFSFIFPLLFGDIACPLELGAAELEGWEKERDGMISAEVARVALVSNAGAKVSTSLGTLDVSEGSSRLRSEESESESEEDSESSKGTGSELSSLCCDSSSKTPPCCCFSISSFFS